MNQGKYLGVLLAAGLLLLSLFSGLYIYKTGFLEGKESINAAQSMNGTNNIQNNIDNNGADSAQNNVENTIENQGGEEVQNNITNNITNNVKVTVEGDGDVVNSVTNSISNGVMNGTGNGNDSGNGNGNGNGSGNENDSGNGSGGDNGNGDGESDLVWGIDTASATNEEFNMCVRDNFGDPEVVGRYLGDKEGVSAGLTQEEAELVKSNNDEILLIHNRFSDATGFENGVQEGEEAISLARELGAPEGTAIFADIEPTYPVNSDFIRGWYDALSSSAYVPGIYGIFSSERNLAAAYNQAVSQNSNIQEDTYIWTAAPNVGITTEANAPEYQPAAPEGAIVIGWQYGLDAQECNIDTNLFDNEYTDVLW
ncbi:glycoside hydrolase domain-containing protein [Rossellomorea vietnamensis]|nr:glycoside hydrolase domain-containing protein [Rossellomorea vietnamensis]